MFLVDMKDRVSAAGLITIGDGVSTTGSFNTYDIWKKQSVSLNSVLKIAVAYCRNIRVLAGNYTMDDSVTLPPSSEISFARGAIVSCSGTGAAGIFSVTGGDVTISGGFFRKTNAVNNQPQITVSSGSRALIDRVTIDFDVDGVSATPMIGFYGLFANEVTIRDCDVRPRLGVVGSKMQLCYRVRVNEFNYTNGVYEGVLNDLTNTHRRGYVGVWFDDCQFVQCHQFRAWGIGLITNPELPHAAIWVRGTNLSAEDGHIVITSPQVENFCGSTYLLAEGVRGWLEMASYQFGYSNNGIYRLGDAAIKVTRNAATTERSARILFSGGRIHNVARSFAVADAALPTNPATAASISVTGTNTFNLAAGSWGYTPAAGEWINVTGGPGSSASNNGRWKVASATSTAITVVGTPLTNGAASSGTINAATSWEGAAVYLEHGTGVSIKGLQIDDHRGLHAIVLQAGSLRGLVLSDIDIHKGTGVGCAAPITLLGNVQAGHAYAGIDDDMAGIHFGRIGIHGFGDPGVPTSIVPIGNGTFDGALNPTPASPTGVYFPNGLGDAGASYGPVTAGTAIEDLSQIVVMS